MIQDTSHLTPGQQTTEEETLNIRDFLMLCLANWKWFLVSIFILVFLAGIYIMRSTPIYTRTASVMIKDEESGGGAMSNLVSQFSDMGLSVGSTNVNNELLAFQSPALLGDVIEKLGLTTSYTYRKRLKKLPLYGDSLVLKVDFLSLKKNESAAFKMTPDGKGKVELTDFKLKGKDVDGDDVIAVIGDTVTTPVGRVFIDAGPNYSPEFDHTINVSRTTLPAAIEAYSAETKIDLANDDATVIDITVTDASIQRAVDIINTLVDIYNQKWVEDRNLMAVTTSSFINDRLNVIEQELGNVDSDISNYKSEHLLPDLQMASEMYMQQYNDNTKQEFELSTQKSIATYLREYVGETTGAGRLLPANSGLDSNGIEQQISEYNKLQLERDRLAANSGETNPLITDYDRNLKAMRTAINSSLDNLLMTINAQLKTLRRAESNTNQQIASSPNQAKYLLSVERQQKVKEALYLFLLEKREENELSRAFTAYNTRVITPPFGDDRPTSPKKANILIIGFILGLLIPAVYLFISDSLDTYVRNRGDLDGVLAPYLGEIPLAGKHVGKWAARWHKFIGKFRKEKSGDSAPKLVVRARGRNVINEAFRSLRTSVEFLTPNQKSMPSFMVTSFNPGSGKSFITLNLAASFAIKDTGSRILAVDLDLRRASLSAAVNSPARGISGYLSGAVSDIKSVIVKSPCEGLDVLPVGTIPPNPSELLYTDRFKNLMESLKENYDYVFIDCPPVDIVTDASIITKYIDATLFVLRAGLLDRRMLPLLNRYYSERKYKNMSVVLNGTSINSTSYSRYGYNKYYSSDYYHKED